MPDFDQILRILDQCAAIDRSVAIDPELKDAKVAQWFHGRAKGFEMAAEMLRDWLAEPPTTTQPTPPKRRR